MYHTGQSDQIHITYVLLAQSLYIRITQSDGCLLTQPGFEPSTRIEISARLGGTATFISGRQAEIYIKHFNGGV